METDNIHECTLKYENHAMPFDKNHDKKSLQGKTSLADKHRQKLTFAKVPLVNKKSLCLRHEFDFNILGKSCITCKIMKKKIIYNILVIRVVTNSTARTPSKRLILVIQN